uniref:RNase H type-1 domain-containing protein n=1 Tax=Cannabis sativa TaxID=3483 RepID=A0A803NMT1_CANSA
MWKLRMPPKIKNHLWRTGTNCLPTMDQLRIKRVEVSALCPFCQNENETVLHCLVTCQVIKEVWKRVGIGTRVEEGAGFLDWCREVFRHLDSEKKAHVAALCWAIWGAINGVAWNKKTVNISNIISSTTTLNQWSCAQNLILESSIHNLMSGDGAEHWATPSTNSAKVNVDAAMFVENHSFGFGIVARDCCGVLIQGKTVYYQGHVDPPLAEAMGVREVLSWIKTFSWQQVVLETDSLVVVQALRSSMDMISLFGLVIKDCKNLLAIMRNVSVIFVKQSANSVAHAFARASSSYPDCVFSLGMSQLFCYLCW